MPAEFPWQMSGRVRVLTALPEIGIATSGELRAIVSRWLSREDATVVDLSVTVFCDRPLPRPARYRSEAPG